MSALGEFLERHELLRRLSGLERDHLADGATLRNLVKGTVIYRQGEPTDGMYLLLSGSIELSRMNRQGHRFSLARLVPGDLFGDLSILDNGPRPVTTTVLENSEVAHFGDGFIGDLVEARDRVALELINILCVQASRRLRDLNLAIVESINEPTALGGETLTGRRRPDAAFFHGLMAGLYKGRGQGGEP